MRSKRLVLFALSALLALTACGRRSRSVALPPPPAAAPVPAAAPAPASPPAVIPPVSEPVPVPVWAAALEQADSAFSAGSYNDAARNYEDYLRTVPASGQRDQAMFRLALAYTLRTDPAPDWQRASNVLKTLVDTQTDSPLKPAAALILSLRADLDKASADSHLRDQRIRQLANELDRLKKIDADRRKRP